PRPNGPRQRHAATTSDSHTPSLHDAPPICLYITSAWRSQAYQAELYENRGYRFQLEGYSREESEIIGATVVARPGTSEHELGLSVDLLTQEYQVLDSGFAETAAYDWLQEHCAE